MRFTMVFECRNDQWEKSPITSCSRKLNLVVKLFSQSYIIKKTCNKVWVEKTHYLFVMFCSFTVWEVNGLWVNEILSVPLAFLFFSSQQNMSTCSWTLAFTISGLIIIIMDSMLKKIWKLHYLVLILCWCEVCKDKS